MLCVDCFCIKVENSPELSSQCQLIQSQSMVRQHENVILGPITEYINALP